MNNKKLFLSLVLLTMSLGVVGCNKEDSSSSASSSVPPSSSSVVSSSSASSASSVSSVESSSVVSSSSASSSEASSSVVSSSSVSSLDPNDVSKLEAALERLGTNYTSTLTTSDGDDYSPKTVFGDGFYSQYFVYQVCGFAKVSSDSNKFYHYFDHYQPGNQDPNEEENYFKMRGRRDFTDEDLYELASAKDYMPANKFVKKAENCYHSDDREVAYNLAVRNNYEFGFSYGCGTKGIDLYLDDAGNVSYISLYGVGDMETGLVSVDRYGTITFSDIGTSVDSVLSEYISQDDLSFEPSYDDITLVSDKGEALYEGLTYHFEDVVLYASIGGDSPVGYAVSSDYFGFYTEDVSAFNAEDMGKAISFDANISAKYGGIILRNVSNVEVNEEIEDACPGLVEYEAEGWVWDIGDKAYGQFNGSNMGLYSVTYDGAVNDEEGNLLYVNVKYTYSGIEYPIKLTFANSDAKEAFESFVEDEEIEEGSVFDFCNGVLLYTLDGVTINLLDNTEYTKEFSFTELCDEVFGEVPTLYSGFGAYEVYYDMWMPGTDGSEYKGIVAFANIDDDKVSGFEDNYKQELIDAGWTYNGCDFADDDIVYYFRKDNLFLLFVSKSFEDNSQGGHYYAQIQIADLNQVNIPEDEPVEE